MAAFRILSLDGGGLLGAFTAGVLASLEKQTGKKIFEHFDLITGTSTGGLIAIGLGMGASAEQILDFYRKDGAKIFPKTGRVGGWVRTLGNIFHPKFQPGQLRAAVGTVVSDQPLRAARTRLAIPSYQSVPGRVYIFKTPHNAQGRGLQDADVPAIDVALATSAAPTYFPAHRIEPGGVLKGIFIDGGVWANCPAMVGIVEAVAFCGQRLEDIDMLSISTTNYPFAIGHQAEGWGFLGWGPKIIETFMFGQIQAAVAQAGCLLGSDRFLRIDFDTVPSRYAMDDPAGVQELVALGTAEAEKIANRRPIVERFLNGSTIQRFTECTAPAG
jgi:patatin-like phospholipase/acyl hydrolase